MPRPHATTRWILTALLAAWLPLCMCQATALIQSGLGLVGIGAPGESCCAACNAAEHDAPATATDRAGCCDITLKAPPRHDRWEPSEPPALILAAPAGTPDLLPRRAHAHAADRAAPVPPAACSLLRQHCALIV